MLNGSADGNKIFAQAMESAQHYYLSLVALGKAQGDIDANLDDDMAATVFRAIMSEMGRYIVQRIVAERGQNGRANRRSLIFQRPSRCTSSSCR